MPDLQLRERGIGWIIALIVLIIAIVIYFVPGVKIDPIVLGFIIGLALSRLL